MTNRDLFFSILTYRSYTILDYVAGVFAALSVIIILLCFLGRKGKLSKATFVPLLVFLGLGFGFHLFCVFHDYLKLYRIWNEPCLENPVGLIGAKSSKTLSKLYYSLSIFFACFFTFEKNRIVNALEAVPLTHLLTDYIMLETAYMIMYFSKDPRKTWAILTRFEETYTSYYIFIYMLLSLVITIIVFLLLYFEIYKKQRIMYTGWRFRIQFVIWYAFSASICMIPFSFGTTDLQYKRLLGYELGTVIPVMGILFPILLVNIISRHYALEKTLIQEDYITAELAYINQYKQNQNETKAFRHDIINNLSILSILFTEENYDKADEYLNSLLGKIKDITPKFITGDEMLDCIVGMKSSIMEKEGITFTIDGVVDGGLGMKPVDICNVFADALDHAIEACEKLSKEKWISLSMKKTEKYFSIKLSNPIPSDEDLKKPNKKPENKAFVSRIGEWPHHDFGTHKLKAIIHQYDGIEKVEAKDGIYTLSIMIPRNI